MSEVTIQTTEVMNRKMTALLFKHNGRNKGFVSGTVFTDDLGNLEKFIDEVNGIIQGTENEN